MTFLVVISGDKERVTEHLSKLLEEEPEKISGFMVFSTIEESLQGMVTCTPSSLLEDKYVANQDSDIVRKKRIMVIDSRTPIRKDFIASLLREMPCFTSHESELQVVEFRHAEKEKREARNNHWKENLRSASCKGRLNNKKR